MLGNLLGAACLHPLRAKAASVRFPVLGLQSICNPRKMVEIFLLAMSVLALFFLSSPVFERTGRPVTPAVLFWSTVAIMISAVLAASTARRSDGHHNAGLPQARFQLRKPLCSTRLPPAYLFATLAIH